MKQFIKKYFFTKVCVLGDSHSSVFSFMNANFISNVWFDVTSVGGATAFGLANPNSRTNALEVFQKKIDSLDKKTPIVVLLGEVDTGYLIWWRSQSNGTDVNFEFNLSITNYRNFLLSQQQKGFTSIYVLSATLPTIKDNFKEHGEIAGARNSVTASQEERTQLTLAYNNELRSICDDNGFYYLDTDKLLLDQETGLIREVFLNENPLDHHCDSKKYAEVIIKKLTDHNLIKWTISKPLPLRG